MSEPSGVFSTNFRAQYNGRVSVPAVSVHLLALGPFFIFFIPSFSLFNSKVVSPGLNPSTCSWSGTLKGCLVEDGGEEMIGKTAACVSVRVSACKLCGNLCPCVCVYSHRGGILLRARRGGGLLSVEG